jgi:hypothetical protein
MVSTITGGFRRTLLYVCGSCILVASVAAGFLLFHATARASLDGQSPRKPILSGGLRSFEIVPLETVSETSSNASIGDLNGDGHPDIVLVKGRHWQVTSKIFFGDGKGHFTPGPALPSKAAKSYSASLADMTGSGHLDMVLSNDQPDPKLVLLNDGKGNFTVGGTYGDPHWSTRNAAVGELNGDGYPDIVVANREMTSYVCLNDGKLHFDCRPLEDSPSAASVAIADMNGDGANDVIYACRDSCQSVVYFNDGKGNFTAIVIQIYGDHGIGERRGSLEPNTIAKVALTVIQVDKTTHLLGAGGDIEMAVSGRRRLAGYRGSPIRRTLFRDVQSSTKEISVASAFRGLDRFTRF